MSEQGSQKFNRAVTIVALLLLVLAFLTVYAEPRNQLGSTGIIVHGDLFLEFLEEDKTTQITTINWGVFNRFNEPKYKYGWMHTEYYKFRWNSSAPSFLDLKLTVELSPNLWKECPPNKNISLNNPYTHFYFELSALPTSETSFNFTIEFWGLL